MTTIGSADHLAAWFDAEAQDLPIGARASFEAACAADRLEREQDADRARNEAIEACAKELESFAGGYPDGYRASAVHEAATAIRALRRETK